MRLSARTAITILILTATATPVWAVGVIARVGDVTKIKGQRVNTLVGMGLVTGLAGTGDGDDYLPAMRPLAAALKNFSNPVANIDELGGSTNVAIVMLEAKLPENGVREGERVDVMVTAYGGCKSLKGGRLLITPLLYHEQGHQALYAYASGPIEITSEEEATSGVVHRGAVLEADVMLHFRASGVELPFSSTWIQPEEDYITLVIEDAHASWAMAHEIASTVNTELAETAAVDQVALAADPKNVIVLVPENQKDLAAWIREIERTVLLVPEAEARVIVDKTSGTIVVSGDALISPVIVSQKGLTITIQPPRTPEEAALLGPQTQSFVGIDPTGSGTAKVGDLLEALKPLNVPIEDRIEILTKIHRLGKLHAELIFEE